MRQTLTTYWCTLALAAAALPPAWAHHIDAKAEIHPTAVLMGDVTVGPYTRIGPKAVIQGNITIGAHTNILGNVVIQAGRASIGNYVRIDYGARVLAGRPAVPGVGTNGAADEAYVRDDCCIGVNATVRGSRMEDGSAVGSGGVADFNTHLGKGAVLAPGAISAHDMEIPANALVEGNPGEITSRAVNHRDLQRIFGVIPADWIRFESKRIAAEIDRNPPQPKDSYPGIDGRQFWSGKPEVDPTAQIHPTAILMGNIVVGAHTRIGPNVIIGENTKIGSYCEIGANTNIRAPSVIGDHVYIGPRVHVGDSRTGGFDNPLWIKSYTYIGPGSVLHATKVDGEVYYGANVTSDYGTYIGEGSIVRSGAAVPHDFRIRDHAVFERAPGLMQREPGISDARRLELTGFNAKTWIQQVLSADLDNKVAYETPLKDWPHTNRGAVKGTVRPGAILVGNVNVGEGTRIFPGAYIEGNVTIGKRCDIVVDTMLVSGDLQIGDHTHVYDKGMIVDGPRGNPDGTPSSVPGKIRLGIFCWINHMAAIQGSELGEFSLANLGVSTSPGTVIGREALLLNGSATYANQNLPARSICWGTPAKPRVLDSTMWEREFLFYGKSWPTWERQATEEELKSYTIPH